MKKYLKNSFPLLVLLVGIGSVMTGQAQTFTTLHSFNEAEGNGPGAELVLSGIVVNAQLTVANPISGTERFFRLSQ